MNSKRRGAKPVISGMAWTAIGSVRRARDTLPYSSRLLTYLLSDQSGVNEQFHLGQWLSQLDEQDLLHVCQTAIRVAEPVDTSEDLEARADMVMLAEVVLFEELRGELEVTPEGHVPAVRALGVCAGLEYVRRRGWVATSLLSLDLDLVRAMLTPAGEREQHDVFDSALLEVFAWVDHLPAGCRGPEH